MHYIEKSSKETMNREERTMTTIVEYSSNRKVINAYPAKIVSPPFPSPCCTSSKAVVGDVHAEQGWPFVYQRCAVCGYTVRHFAPAEEVLEAIRIWRKTGQVVPTPQAA